MTKNSDTIRRLLRDIIYICLGAVFLGLGLVFFLVPNKIATGGVAGLAIVVHYLTNFPTGLSMLILNIPLLIIRLVYLGKKFLLRTFFAIAMGSFFIDFFRN
jgi:uncharacterized membrane-anchored protein YitT (DUF2179 family)